MGRICMHIRQSFVDLIQNEISKNTVMRCDSSHISTSLDDVNYEFGPTLTKGGHKERAVYHVLESGVISHPDASTPLKCVHSLRKKEKCFLLFEQNLAILYIVPW